MTEAPSADQEDTATVAAESASADGAARVLAVTVAGRAFALPLDAVVEVVEPGPVAPVPLAPPAAAGLFNLHGRPALAIDPARWLGLSSKIPAERRRAVVVARAGVSYGILVDGLGAVGAPARTDAAPDDAAPLLDLGRLLALEPPGDTAMNQPPGDTAIDQTPGDTAAPRPRPPPPEPQDPVPPEPPEPDPDPVAGPQADDAEAASLHDRLGGSDGLREAVARLGRRVAADPLLAPFAAGIDPARLAALQADFLAMAFGGPAAYGGPPLAAIQARLAKAGFGPEEEEAVALHLRHALLEGAVAEDAAAEAVAAVRRIWSDLLGQAV